MFASIFLRILNWEASLSRNNPTRIFESLYLHEGQVIAEIGSGGGYFTVQFARKVGKTGRVYAVDIEQDYLDFVKRRSEKEGLNNILSILAAGDWGVIALWPSVVLIQPLGQMEQEFNSLLELRFL